MEEKYWKQFLKTGSVRDYLSYRNMDAESLRQQNGAADRVACRQGSMPGEGEAKVESDHGNWHGADSGANGGI